MPYTDRIDAGTVSGIRLYLTRHFEHNGKHYYYLSRSGLDQSDDNRLTITEIDTLFNPGGHTTNTQEGSHDGSDDERSIIVSGGFGIVLPTINELLSLLGAGNSGDVTLPYPFGTYVTANYERPAPDFESLLHWVCNYIGDSTSVGYAVHHINPYAIVQFIETATPDDPTTLLFLPPPTSLKTTLSRVTLLRGQTSILNFTFSNSVSGFSLANIINPEDTISNFEILEAGKSYKAILTPDANTDRPTNSFGVDLSGIQYEVAGTGPYGSVPLQIINYIVNTNPLTIIPEPPPEPIPAWPDSLPGASSNRYELKPRGSFKRTEMTSGISRHRRISRNPPTEIIMSWDMSITEFALFEAFFVYALNEGEKWFTMESSSSKGCIEGHYRFVKMEEPYKAQAITSDRFQVTASLELRYKNLLDRPAVDALSNISPDISHLPIWFDSLPDPLVQSYSIKPQSSIRRTSIESGANQHAATSYDIPTLFTMQWNMTNQQFLQFQSFYQYNLNDGQSWFYMDHAEGIGFVPGEFRFIKSKSPYTARYLSHEHFSVNATLERRSKKLMYRDTYNIIICDDQGITDLVFDDAYSRLHIYLHHTLPSIQGQW